MIILFIIFILVPIVAPLIPVIIAAIVSKKEYKYVSDDDVTNSAAIDFDDDFEN